MLDHRPTYDDDAVIKEVFMLRKFMRLICLPVAAIAFPAMAHASASNDTTIPTTAAVAENTPKGALKAYNAAMRSGDVAAMVSLQHSSTDDERRVARSCAQSDLEVGKLIKAASDKFGSDAAKKVSQTINDEGDDDVDAAEESVKGDHGGVTFAGGNSPSPLVRVDGAWKVDVAEMLKQYGGSTDSLCESVIRRGSVAKVTTQELVAGQYANVDALVAALQDRLKDE